MLSTLNNHPVWQTLDQTMQQLDPAQIAIQHLQACNVQINGYWDEDEYYEAISFAQTPHPELTSTSWEISPHKAENNRWLHLKFSLTINPSKSSQANTPTSIGDLILILDENLDVIDENWLIDVHSPYVRAVHEPGFE